MSFRNTSDARLEFVAHATALLIAGMDTMPDQAPDLCDQIRSLLGYDLSETGTDLLPIEYFPIAKELCTALLFKHDRRMMRALVLARLYAQIQMKGK